MGAAHHEGDDQSVLSRVLRAAAARGEQVAVRDVAEAQRKLAAFVAAGPARLQVVTDFDRTLTRCFNDRGEMVATSHGAVERSTALGPAAGRELHELFNEYYPREISHELSRAEREVFMTEWWTKSHELFVRVGLRRDAIAGMLAESNMELRPGTPALFATLRAADVPVLVFSAGLADVLEAFLQREGLLGANTHVVSNRMIFDARGVLVGFDGELIHSLNKNGTALRGNRAGWAHDPARTHALLLGDNLSDTEMVSGLQHDDVLTVGFLNDKVDERRAAYEAAFDLVVLHDGSMGLVQDIVAAVLAGR